VSVENQGGTTRQDIEEGSPKKKEQWTGVIKGHGVRSNDVRESRTEEEGWQIKREGRGKGGGLRIHHLLVGN